MQETSLKYRYAISCLHNLAFHNNFNGYDDVIYITSTLNAPKEVIIYDVFGKAVLRNNLHTTPLDISHLDSGVYVLQVTEEKKTSTRKLVIK